MKILIGTAGLVDDSNIDCAEIEFTYGVRLSEKRAQQIKEISTKNKTKLSVHAPYYINLNSDENHKIKASMKRIIDSAKAAEIIGAIPVVFHPGFYLKKTLEQTYDVIRDKIAELKDYLNENKIKAELMPETTGKASQFGSIEELNKLYDDLKVRYCIDFSHVVARTNNAMSYREMVNKIPFKEVHAHFSGIEFGDKGERRHIMTPKSSAQKLLKAIHDSNIKKISIISESPDPYHDALMMIKIRDKLK